MSTEKAKNANKRPTNKGNKIKTKVLLLICLKLRLKTNLLLPVFLVNIGNFSVPDLTSSLDRCQPSTYNVGEILKSSAKHSRLKP